MGYSERLARIQVGPVRYNSPWAQVFILGFIVFCSVGMFSALGGLGAGGSQDTQLSDIANSVLYGLFAITGFFAGSVNNILGPRLTMSIGATGYGLYAGSLWAFQLHGTRWFFILAGALLGISAALLWSAQGAIMMSYPLEKDKGRAFALFWTMFQLGTLIGAAIALGITYHSKASAVSTAVFTVFMVIMLTTIVTSWLLLPPNLVVRGDGTLVEVQKALTVKEEMHSFAMQFKDWRLLALFPMFLSSNYFYSYQGAITSFLFNGRTRALSSLLTGLGSIVGSIFIGFIVDFAPFKRRTRGLVGCAAVLILNLIVWSGGLAFQVRFTRHSVGFVSADKWDFTDNVAKGPIVLLMAYYIADASYQGLAYYTMSAMTNDPFRLARMAGYYKGVQSAGSAISFAMDAVVTPFLTELLVSWILLLVSLPLCALVLYNCKDTNYDVEQPVHVGDPGTAAAAGVAVPETSYVHGHHGDEVVKEDVKESVKEV